MKLRTQIAVLLTFVVLVSVAAELATAKEKKTADDAAAVVRMTDANQFAPATVTINVGQTVEWVTTGNGIHAVADDPDLAQEPNMVHLPQGAKPFHSAAITPGKSFKHRFTVPGTYRYICVPHQPQMMGTVIVKSRAGAM